MSLQSTLDSSPDLTRQFLFTSLAMFAFVKIVALVGFASSVFAAPVESPAAAANELVARAPYDTHNGWVST
jgi:hypothetical protein